jgi:hypothetical protein
MNLSLRLSSIYLGIPIFPKTVFSSLNSQKPFLSNKLDISYIYHKDSDRNVEDNELVYSVRVNNECYNYRIPTDGRIIWTKDCCDNRAYNELGIDFRKCGRLIIPDNITLYDLQNLRVGKIHIFDE